MKQAVSLPLLVGLAFLVPHCGGDVRPQNGSESHFLDPCDATGDCGSGLECVCNVCTRACVDTGDCGALSSSAVCGDARTLTVGCTEAATQFCQVGQVGAGGGRADAGTGGSSGSPGGGGVSGSGGGNQGGRAGGVNPDAGTGGSAGGPSDGGTGGSAGGPSDAGPIPPRACDADSGGCFCESLLSCGSDELHQWLPLGSRGYRICGAAGDGCAVNYFTETEGGLSLYRCYAAPGATCVGDPWSSLAEMPCDLVLSCNLLIGDCPADVLNCALPAPAPSCSVLDPGVDACCAGYGVSTISGTCECICPVASVPLFGSIEACRAACGTPPVTCATVDRTQFGNCTAFLGYGYDGTGCIGVSGCSAGSPSAQLFAARDQCWAGCNRSCTDVEAARADLRERASGCSTDDDCMWVESGGPPYDHCSCAVVVNRNLDIGAWRDVNLAYGCFVQDVCCDAVPPDAACIGGRCAPRP